MRYLMDEMDFMDGMDRAFPVPKFGRFANRPYSLPSPKHCPIAHFNSPAGHCKKTTPPFQVGSFLGRCYRQRLLDAFRLDLEEGGSG